MIDIHTIGAGGGSIARRDSGGAFRVGPQSAGAVPGPAGYGRGGLQPTVTDANVVLGRLDPDRFLGGAMKLDAAASRQVMQRFAAELDLSPVAAALGILTVVSANMANAIWSRTAQRGIDPRDYTLVAFGGAGPAAWRRRRSAAWHPGGADPAPPRHHLRHGSAHHGPASTTPCGPASRPRTPRTIPRLADDFATHAAGDRRPFRRRQDRHGQGPL